MIISICIPQYNRIEYLIKNLNILSNQTYADIEIIISDDCSKDNTERVIKELIPHYKYPIVYSRNETNIGYDRNLRKSMELASGDYFFILGNDDSLVSPTDISELVDFLIENQLPEVGFCNYIEEKNPQNIHRRAAKTGVIGTGYEIGLKYYRSFSFVAGIILKKEAFLAVNTAKFDRSVYVQIYLALMVILKNGRLFMIEKPLVLKDIIVPGKQVDSYRDKLSRKWKDFKITDGGLPRVIKVSVAAFKDAELDFKKANFKIIRQVYSITYPYWIVEYRNNNAIVASFGLILGMFPSRVENFSMLNVLEKTYLLLQYFTITFIALITPIKLFNKSKSTLYKLIKR